MKTPTPDDLRLAAEWLDAYEGDGSATDAFAMRQVRDWLLSQAEAQELRRACREAGVTVAQAKQAIRARMKAAGN